MHVLMFRLIQHTNEEIHPSTSMANPRYVFVFSNIEKITKSLVMMKNGSDDHTQIDK